MADERATTAAGRPKGNEVSPRITLRKGTAGPGLVDRSLGPYPVAFFFYYNSASYVVQLTSVTILC